MSADELEPEALLAAYADDPRALSAAERLRVEAWLEREPDAATALAADRATLAAVRGLEAGGGAPDWAALETRIQAATTRAPRHRRAWWVGGAIGVAALAAGLAFYLARPTGDLGPAMRMGVAVPATPDAIGTPDPRETPDDEAVADGDDLDDALAVGDDDDALAVGDDDDGALDGDDLDDALAAGDDDDGDLGGMPAIDEALVDRVLELEAVAGDVPGEADDLPAIGAAWTVVLDDLSDDDLDQALRWLDTQEAG